MRLVLRSSLASANSTHATLRLLPQAGHSQVDVVVRADYIITAIGFTTDAALVRSIGFRSNFLDRLTYETSVRGIFNLGVSGVRPWTDRRSKGRLGTFIEDTQGKVQQVCTAILRHLGVWHPSRPLVASSWCRLQPLWQPGHCAALKSASGGKEGSCNSAATGFWRLPRLMNASPNVVPAKMRCTARGHPLTAGAPGTPTASGQNCKITA